MSRTRSTVHQLCLREAFLVASWEKDLPILRLSPISSIEMVSLLFFGAFDFEYPSFLPMPEYDNHLRCGQYQREGFVSEKRETLQKTVPLATTIRYG